MFALPSMHFGRVLPLFDSSFPNSTMVFSTLEGRTPGKVFVNSLVMSYVAKPMPSFKAPVSLRLARSRMTNTSNKDTHTSHVRI